LRAADFVVKPMTRYFLERSLLLAGILMSFLAASPAAQAVAPECPDPVPLSFQMTGKITRSALGFTQGLEFHDGKLYESTGKVDGPTRVNTISLSGQVATLTDLGASVFGEGLTILGTEMFQLTWQEHKVFAYDLEGKRERQMTNPRDGWGLTNDGKQLIFSDGEQAIYFADPKSFAITKTVPLKAKHLDQIVGLNELELVNGQLYGNLFTTPYIVRIDPATGCLTGVSDLGGLWNAMTEAEKKHIASSPQYVLNGIAYDASHDLFYLTGKRWNSIFTGHFVERH
jgi:glutamine cyclotransferase